MKSSKLGASTEDLGIKIGTPKEVLWAEILEKQKESLTNSEVNTEISEMMIELAKKKIAEEKEKFK